MASPVEDKAQDKCQLSRSGEYPERYGFAYSWPQGRTALQRTWGSLWRWYCLECHAQGSLSEHPWQARRSSQSRKNVVHWTPIPLPHQFAMQCVLGTRHPSPAEGELGLNKWTKIEFLDAVNDSTTSVLFQGKQGNITIYSNSRPWPVMLKKMKWNSSNKTHKTFYKWYPKKMSFTLGNWDAK